MSVVPLVIFIEIYDPELVPPSGNIAGAIQHRFQNSEPSSTGITFNGATFFNNISLLDASGGVVSAVYTKTLSNNFC